jgi:hypothetical protein
MEAVAEVRLVSKPVSTRQMAHKGDAEWECYRRLSSVSDEGAQGVEMLITLGCNQQRAKDAWSMRMPEGSRTISHPCARVGDVEWRSAVRSNR